MPSFINTLLDESPWVDEIFYEIITIHFKIHLVLVILKMPQKISGVKINLT